jgi:hypothetical protein
VRNPEKERMQTHPFETELRLFSGRALFYFCPLPQKATEVELRSVQLESRYLKTHVGSLKPPISDEVLGHTPLLRWGGRDTG